MNENEIIIELDEEDIEILKKGDGVVKEIEHPDMLQVLITKWDIGQEIEDTLAEEAGVGDMVFEPEKPIKVKE